MKLRARFSYVITRYSKAFFQVSSLIYFLEFTNGFRRFVGPVLEKMSTPELFKMATFPDQRGKQTKQCFIRVHLFDVRASCVPYKRTPQVLLSDRLLKGRAFTPRSPKNNNGSILTKIYLQRQHSEFRTTAED